MSNVFQPNDKHTSGQPNKKIGKGRKFIAVILLCFSAFNLGKVSKQPPKYERMVAWDGQRNARDAVTVRVG